MIKIYKTADPVRSVSDLAIYTDVNTEAEFIDDLRNAITKLVAVHSPERSVLSGDFEMDLYAILAHSFEILCKLRGYKSEKVVERRTLQSGFLNPEDGKELISVNGKLIVTLAELDMMEALQKRRDLGE